MNIRHLLVLFASFAISVLTMSAHSGDDSVQAACIVLKNVYR